MVTEEGDLSEDGVVGADDMGVDEADGHVSTLVQTVIFFEAGTVSTAEGGQPSPFRRVESRGSRGLFFPTLGFPVRSTELLKAEILASLLCEAVSSQYISDSDAEMRCFLQVEFFVGVPGADVQSSL